MKRRYGASATAIEFRSELLTQRLTQRAGHAWEDRLEALSGDYTESVRLVVEFLLQQGDTTVESVAAILGTSCRTLQRHLVLHGETFTRLLDRARARIAGQLLERSSLKVIDVANEVGYSDPAHFARAFRRWTGMPPSAYRVQKRVANPAMTTAG
jgi:AraC-like DNA-binding protein